MYTNVKDKDLSLTVEKRLGGYTFAALTSQQKEKIDLVQEVTATATDSPDRLRNGFIPALPNGPPLFSNTQAIQVKPKSLAQQFKIASPLDQPVSFVNPLISDVHAKTESLGLYGRATWKLGADHMVYSTCLRGYKSRAFTFNTSLFNTTCKNFQVQLYPPGQIIPSLELANAAKARIRGPEPDGAFCASSTDTRVSLCAACIDAKFLNFSGGTAYPGQTAAEGAVASALVLT